MSKTTEPAIGIDLGTTFSAVATVRDGKPRLIERRTSQRLLPSMVGFTPGGERVVGEAARFLAETFPENVAYAVKRFMGQRWTPELAAKAKGYLPYPLVAGPQEDVRVKIAGRVLPVVQISAMILTELRLDAEAYFGRDVKRAVITVPANFNDAQRQATREAAQIAGLEVLRLVNEPTAAALAYGLTTGFQGRALVFDLGGGTFDVSVLEVKDGVFEVIATGGDPFLGGEDFDNAIVQWLLAQMNDQDRERVQRDRISMQRLKVVAEQSKRKVSTAQEAVIQLELTPDGAQVNVDTVLTRHFFEQLVKSPAERCLAIADEALSHAGLDRGSVTAVLLVGGMTRVPLIQRLVQEHFGKPPATGIDPDEVVAMGAALHANELGDQKGSVLLLDVVSSTLGVGIAGGLVKPLIARNSALPCSVREVFHTSRDGQTTVRIPVVQGESARIAENFGLGELTLDGLRPARRAELAIEVTFEMGTDGILAVEARDTSTGRAESAKILARTDLVSGEKEKLLRDEERHRAQMAKETKKPEPAAGAPADPPKSQVAPPPPPAPAPDETLLSTGEASRTRLARLADELKALHAELALAAHESKTSEAEALVESVEQQFLRALSVQKAGAPRDMEKLSDDLDLLLDALYGGRRPSKQKARGG